MKDEALLFNWKAVLHETYQEFFKGAVELLPELIGALLLLVVGWIVAKLLRVATRKMILALNTMLPKSVEKHDIRLSQLSTYARWGGNVIFWAVLLFFIAASANLLEWALFTGIASGLLGYLPNLLTGLLIILAGFALSGVARSAVTSAAHSAGMEQVGLLAITVQMMVILTTIVIGVEQLGINVGFLTTTFIVVVGVLLLGAALAFGLGAKSYVANVIGVQAARKHYQIGQRLHIADTNGELLEITQTALILDTEKGRATIPGKFVNESVCQMIYEFGAVNHSSGNSSEKEKNTEGQKNDQSTADGT